MRNFVLSQETLELLNEFHLELTLGSEEKRLWVKLTHLGDVGKSMGAHIEWSKMRLDTFDALVRQLAMQLEGAIHAA